MLEALLIVIVAAVIAIVVLKKRRSRNETRVTPYDGTDAWKAETGDLPPTDKQLDFIADLEDEIDVLNEERDDNAIRVPQEPRDMHRAAASEHIDRLIAIRDRLETGEAEVERASMPTRYRPASIGSRGGLKLEGPDPICTDLEEAKTALAARDIAPRRIPCVVADETGEWKPVWTVQDGKAADF